MRIISDKTGKEYTSVEECLKAEELYDKQQREKAEKAEKLAKEKEARQEAVKAAYENYRKLYKEYLKDYNALRLDFKDTKNNDILFSELIKNFLL